jgi:hypothetical protein
VKARTLKILKKKRDLKERKKESVGNPKPDGILREKRNVYKLPQVTSETYNLFQVNTPIPAGTPFDKIDEIRKKDRKETNKVRSLANKHLKAYLRGKSQITKVGTDEFGKPKIEPIKITSNEFDIYKKV